MAMTKFYHDSLQYNADNNNIEYLAIHKTASLSLGVVFIYMIYCNVSGLRGGPFALMN